MWTRTGAVVVALAIAGCLESPVVVCGEGRLCPPDTVCDPERHCVLPEQLESCDGLSDGASCSFIGTPAGVCRGGVCRARGCGDGFVIAPELCEPGVPSGLDCVDFGFQDARPIDGCLASCEPDLTGCTGVCGDDQRGGDELCDGDDLAGRSCTDFGFYQPDGLACSPVTCRFDARACHGGFCGDDVVNGAELCEPTQPIVDACLDLGFDAGRLGCSQACAYVLGGCRELGWHPEPSNTPKWIYAMWGAAVDDVWAVGALGGITHWDGTTWSVITSPAPTRRMRGLWGAAADDVWAVGESGTILHFDGSWSQPQLPLTSQLLRAVWGSSASDVWAVGEGGVVLHNDGTGWIDRSGTLPSGGANLQAIRGTGSDDVWAVGAGLIAHYTGSWAVVPVADPREWRAVYPRGIDDVFVVGGGSGGKLIRHFDGVAWTAQDVPTTHWFNAVAEFGAGEVVAVGNGGVIAHYDGRAWLVTPTGTDQTLDAVWGVGTRAWAGGESGTLLAIAGNDLLGEITSPASSTTDLFAIHGTSLDDVWIAGDDGYMARFDGTTWSARATAMPPGAELIGLWAGPAPDTAIAVGSDVNAGGSTIGATICAWDGPTLTKSTYGGAALLGVWGAAPDDVWAAGDNGRLLHGGAGGWTDRSSDVPVAAITFKDVWGADAGHVFVPGGDGNLAHYTGTWSVTSVNPAGLIGVWGRAGDDVYAVGGEGVIMHFDGATWSAEDSGTVDQLIELHGAGDHVLAVGRNGTLLELRDGVWSRVRSPLAIDLNGVFVAGDTAIIVADNGVLLEYRWY